jgi:antitoxin MazE
MQVSKWGNSLALRLPVSVVEALKLKEGDHVEVYVAGERTFGIDRSRERALARIRKLRKALPPDWKFDRDTWRGCSARSATGCRCTTD